tara:strand:- start:308 stop:469 length:162 start_codon:yes stop_codon:yes gene_type:complete
MKEPSEENKIYWHERDLGRKFKKIRNLNLDVTVILVSFYNELFDFIVEIHKKY